MRRLLTITALAAVAAVLGGLLVGLATDRGLVWRHRTTSLHLLDPGAAPDPEAWLVLPGFGQDSGRLAARRLAAALGGDAPIAYVAYSDAGVDLTDLDVLIAGYARWAVSHNFQARLSIYGDSMGGAVALAASSGADIPLARVVLDSSPFDLSTAVHGDVGRLVAAVGYQGGPVGSYLYDLANDVHRDGLAAAPLDLARAAAEIRRGPPAALWASQVRLMADAGDRLAAGTRPAGLGPATRVLYVGPADRAADHTVDEGAAVARFRAWLGPAHVRLDVIGVPRAGHADTARVLGWPPLRSWLVATAPAPAPSPPLVRLM